LLDEARILSFIKIFRDELWPGGKLKPPSVPRTSEEKFRSKEEANRKLSSLVPGMFMILGVTITANDAKDLVANMIGRSNARRGARRMFAVLQNRRLNQHIAYTVADEVCLICWHMVLIHPFNPFLWQVFAALFPESNVKT
jgi:sorting nexin-25